MLSLLRLLVSSQSCCSSEDLFFFLGRGGGLVEWVVGMEVSLTPHPTLAKNWLEFHKNTTVDSRS